MISGQAFFGRLRGARQEMPSADYSWPVMESVPREDGDKPGRCLYRARRPRHLDDCVIAGEGGVPKPTFAMICQLNTPTSQETEEDTITTAPSSVFSGEDSDSGSTLEFAHDERISSPRASHGVNFLGHSPTSARVGAAEAAGEVVACRAALMGRRAIPVYGSLVEL
eukprot:TRINITY_DN125235_c0_g1_i1.p1 TRINITY_DN125235_c0_g1~~TRINITY_DN125235_c0_g1_i1.p1  ORF type:complete len:167 (+),score=27.22 TRINITY_DN125235_c0_g1_i1:95-595(+)